MFGKSAIKLNSSLKRSDLMMTRSICAFTLGIEYGFAATVTRNDLLFGDEKPRNMENRSHNLAQTEDIRG